MLISIDTLRADALGSYGQERDTSPRLDELASEAVVFDRAHTVSPNTIIAHASLLTSLHPVSHAARPDRPLARELTTLAERLQDAGYHTGGFTAHSDWLDESKGFDQGFDHFESHWWNAEEIGEAVSSWLSSPLVRWNRWRDRPLFLFVHYYDVHSDFADSAYETGSRFDDWFVSTSAVELEACRAEPCASKLLQAANRDPSLISTSQVEWLHARYHGGVRYTDHHVGSLLDELARHGLFEPSWIVVTADHGEEFREHGRLLHSQPYVETSRIPLLVKPPERRRGPRATALVSLVDVMPTLLDAAGLEIGDDVQGRSLAPLLRGEETSPTAEARPAFFTDHEDPAKVSVRRGPEALLQVNGTELYDTRNDPGETRDLSGERSEPTQALLSIAERFHAERVAEGEGIDVPPIRVSAEERERLRSLGYVD